jgi:DNA gyrase subunit A
MSIDFGVSIGALISPTGSSNRAASISFDLTLPCSVHDQSPPFEAVGPLEHSLATTAKTLTGLSTSQIIVHTTFLGGGLGRKFEVDFVSQAIQAAMQLYQKTGAGVLKLMWPREEDVVNHLFVASTHSYLMVFSDRGRAYWLKVHEIPDVGADGRGKSIANLVQMESGEKIADMLAVREFDDTHFVVMGTRNGTIKQTELSAFSNPRAGGIIAMGVEENDAVMAVQLSDGASEVFIGTREGKAIRFPEEEVRSMGRAAYGVRGIQLREGDEVVAMQVAKPGGRLLTVTERGYAKQTELGEYRVTGRGGLGIKNVEISDKNGLVVNSLQLQDSNELLVITEQGKILRTPGSDIRTAGRATQGVRLMDLEPGDRVVSVALVAKTEEEVIDDTGVEPDGTEPPPGEPGSGEPEA